MGNLLSKELRLAAHPLSFFFLAFSLMALIPGYPILVGGFFICFGIFQTFQNGRETNDVLYTALLPIEKGRVVKARFLFVCSLQLTGWLLTAGLTALRMTLLGSAEPYVHNPMMNSNPVFLAWMLLIFTLFNCLFAGPFYKTAYKFGRPFIAFILAATLTVGLAETLHRLPGLEFLNTGERLPLQGALLAAAAAVYGLGTAAACRRAVRRFEALDL